MNRNKLNAFREKIKKMAYTPISDVKGLLILASRSMALLDYAIYKNGLDGNVITNDLKVSIKKYRKDLMRELD